MSARRPGERRGNLDGSSTFRAYRIAGLPAEFVCARVQSHRIAA